MVMILRTVAAELEDSYHSPSIFRMSCRAKKDRLIFPNTSASNQRGLVGIRYFQEDLHIGMESKHTPIWIEPIMMNGMRVPLRATNQSYAK